MTPCQPMMLVAECPLDGAQPVTYQVFSTRDRLLLPEHIGRIARDVVPLSAHRLIEDGAEFGTPIPKVSAPAAPGDDIVSSAGVVAEITLSLDTMRGKCADHLATLDVRDDLGQRKGGLGGEVDTYIRLGDRKSVV